MNRYDLDYALFDGLSGIGNMIQLFGDEMGSIIDEMNEALFVFSFLT